MSKTASAPAARLRNLGSDDSGVAAVEMALLGPVLVVILAGVLNYGVYFGAANSVQQLAASAARASIAGMSKEDREKFAKASVSTTGQSYVLINAAKLSVVTKSDDKADTFEVSVLYDTRGTSLSALRGLIPMPPETITRKATIALGGY